MVDVHRTTSIIDQSRTYLVPHAGVTGVLKFKITITGDSETDWNAIEPTVFGAIGCLLGPERADQAVLVR